MSIAELEEENRCLRLNCKNLEEEVESLQQQLKEEADFQKRVASEELRAAENKLAAAKKKQKELWGLWTDAEKRAKALHKQLATSPTESTRMPHKGKGRIYEG